MNFPDLTIIAAMNNRFAIGLNGGLPWVRIPADMSRFRRLTGTKPIIMGRKTHESIGYALPNRRNIVLTRNCAYNPIDCEISHSLSQAFSLVASDREVCVIGGEKVYADALAIEGVNIRMYLTFVDDRTKGDTAFPVFDQRDFYVTSRKRIKKGSNTPYNIEFVNMIKYGRNSY